MKNFFLAFVPIFVAVDAVGILPMFMSLTEGLDRGSRNRVIRQSVITALVVAVGFIFLGRSIFDFMNITDDDFMVAGGALLFLLATRDLMIGTKAASQFESVGAVPLGTPLIVGPAVLTSALMLTPLYGTWPTLLSVVVNVVLAGVVLMAADLLTRLLGQAGSKVVSKVAHLLLAAIAVMMIRKGLVHIITGVHAAGTSRPGP